MKATFWGVRGSHPKPITPNLLKSKISAVVQRIQEKDIQTAESRELFLANLPRWLYGTPGGNTPCLEIRLNDNNCLIFDAGTGIVECGTSLLKEREGPKDIHMFFSHFHYDHIQGLPFFPQAYIPGFSINFYSPVEEFEHILKSQMRHPYFPITMEEKMIQNLSFNVIQEEVNFPTAIVRVRGINHPGGSFAYKVEEGNKNFIIATDYELRKEDFEMKEQNFSFFKDCDVLVLDTMYTLGEAIDKYNWGHSSFSLGVDFAKAWNVKKLVLFHHEPQYDDKRLHANLRSARWYAQRQGAKNLEIIIAEEGLELRI